jgi:hypothetical protein
MTTRLVIRCTRTVRWTGVAVTVGLLWGICHSTSLALQVLALLAVPLVAVAVVGPVRTLISGESHSLAIGLRKRISLHL